MMPDIPPQLLSALADAPLAALMLWMLHNLRREMQVRPEAPPANPSHNELIDFKLEVARTYVPLSLIRDLDARLSLHLVRIEEKLDEVSRTATAATAIAGHTLPGRRMGFSARTEANPDHGDIR